MVCPNLGRLRQRCQPSNLTKRKKLRAGTFFARSADNVKGTLEYNSFVLRLLPGAQTNKESTSKATGHPSINRMGETRDILRDIQFPYSHRSQTPARFNSTRCFAKRKKPVHEPSQASNSPACQSPACGTNNFALRQSAG